ncbi:hypothetical protein HY631_03770 [Candidatus Uhrbacteria bacterium]|nr:hypothetical protein [Candidatus Uhrbacteria bacterium]
MMRLLLLSLLFLLLTSLELGFVFALPFPIDRTPLVLAISVFVFQALDVRLSAWWVVFHGMMLDILRISFVPFEVVSYALAALVLVLVSQHLFSNRSFWGILGTLTLSLIALTCAQIFFAVVESLFGAWAPSLQDLLSLRAWGWGLSTVLLLFLFPLSQVLNRLRARSLSF